MPKRSIREQMLRARRLCDPQLCGQWGARIQARFLADPYYSRATCVGLYSPLGNEVQTERVARQAWADGKHVAFPRVRGQELDFCLVSSLSELTPGAFGILEPATQPSLPLAALDLLVLPGVAFDLGGHRLGFGKGYYDRALVNCPLELALIGFAYEFQVVERLPAADHDCRVTRLVTEQRTLVFAG